MITRFLPFVVFSKGNPPAFISYLGRVLPPAAIGLLVVYCLKDAVFTSYHALRSSSPSPWSSSFTNGAVACF